LLSATIEGALDGLGWHFRPSRLVGIAGTVTTLCAVALGLHSYDSDVVHGHRLPRAEVGRVIGLLRSLPLVERRKLPGLPEGRADVLFAGATILEHILERFGTNEVTVSDQGVRWGLLWREIDRRYPPPKLAVDKP
jgi:exopolyphosphatase/guanosine-5'-triphosphate,3'-diphosphate pyrophosphatase